MISERAKFRKRCGSTRSGGERWILCSLQVGEGVRRVKEESEEVGVKLHIQKTKIIASSPITLWEIDGKTMETVSDFILGAPKSLQMLIAAMKLKDTYSSEEKL